MIITSLTIAPPETGVDCMPRQRRHFSNAVTCFSSVLWRLTRAITPEYRAFGEFPVIVIAAICREADPT
jgi:hypothetical protein